MYKVNCASLETLCDHSHTALKCFQSLVAIQNTFSDLQSYDCYNVECYPLFLILWARSCCQLHPE